MINANNEPEAVGLKKLFGKLISHCRKHPNLKLAHLAFGDYGNRATGLDFMKYNNCICCKC